MDLQDKFERNLEQMVDQLNTPSRSLEIVNTRKFSNIGTILIQNQSNFASLVTLDYEFYDFYLTIKMTPQVPGWTQREGDKSVFRASFGPHGGSIDSIEILSTVIDSVVAALT